MRPGGSAAGDDDGDDYEDDDRDGDDDDYDDGDDHDADGERRRIALIDDTLSLLVFPLSPSLTIMVNGRLRVERGERTTGERRRTSTTCFARLTLRNNKESELTELAASREGRQRRRRGHYFAVDILRWMFRFV